MALKTSRYLMTFAFAILSICGLTLVDQLPGISLNPNHAGSSRPAPVRTAHTLQPIPPIEPQWDPNSAIDAQMDYPDLYGDQFSEPADVPTRTVAFHQNSPIDEPTEAHLIDWSPEPAVDSLAASAETTLATEPFPDFEPEPPRLPAVHHATDVLESDGGTLGPASPEPWQIPGIDETPHQTLQVPQANQELRGATNDAGRSETEVVVLSFVGPEEPSAATPREPTVPTVIEGSHRIRTLVQNQSPPRRLTGTFRFGGPPVEPPVQTTQPQDVKACRHTLRNGQKVCPHCGIIWD